MVLRKQFGALVLGASLLLTTSFAALLPQSATAQMVSGDLVGMVSDSTGAAIPNATVTATNTATGVKATSTSNGQGSYRLPNLLAGTYDISVAATGFSDTTQKGFAVELSKTATLNLTLAAAGGATTVEVSADAGVALDTTTVQLQQTFSAKELTDLPSATVGLGVLNLSLLSPGVASSGGVGAGTGPSVGGQRPRANNYTIEGIDNNNKSVTGPLVYVPNDAVGNFTLIVNQFSPEFGHSTGGQFNSTIKSGSNSFHGVAYEYFDNRDLNAVNVTAGTTNSDGSKVSNPRYDFNRYGGEVGGPIVRDKIFFFGNYERQTLGQSGSATICTPTAAGIAALSSSALGLNATNLAQYVKYTPVSPSQIDAADDNACFNSTKGPQFLEVYPGTKNVGITPDYGETGLTVFGSGTPVLIPLGNLHISAPSFTNEDVVTVSTDYTISNNDSFRGRYVYNNVAGIDTAAQLPAFYQPLPNKFHLIALSEYHNYTPNLTNEARAGFNRYFNITPSGPFTFPGAGEFPNLTFYDQDIAYGPDGNAPQSTIQNLYQFTDNISWVKGNHTFKFGFDGRKFISPQSFTQRVRGDYYYNYLTEYLHDLAPTNFGERSTGNFFFYGDQTAFYGYGNDTWRVTPSLTLNYGLRYEFTSVPTGERAQKLNSAASVPGLINFSEPKPQYKNFAPRLGIDYAPDQKTSIRAGFSMAYDVIYDNLGILSFPPQYSSTTDVGSGAPGIANPGDPNFLAGGGLPAGKGGLATFCVEGTGPGTGVPCTVDKIAQRENTSAYVPDQKLPYAETWSLGVQRIFASNYTAEIRYVGTRGIHLPTQLRINRVAKVDSTHFLPTYSGRPSDAELASLKNTVTTIEARDGYVPAYEAQGFDGDNVVAFQPASESNYNGLAASLVRRFQNGLQMDLAYTWSKTMDDATADVFSTVLSPRRAQDFNDVSNDYSRSALDHTHRLTLEAVYDLPFYKHSNWLLKNLVGNWAIDPIYTYESPEYATVLSGGDANQNGDSAPDRSIHNLHGVKGTGSGVIAIGDQSRADLCPADTPPDANGRINCAANTVAYQPVNPHAEYIQAGIGAMANSQRNTLPIRPINDLDVTALKRFSFTERYALEFQAQAFNVLNHPQYIPGTVDNIDSPSDTYSTPYQEPQSPNFNKPGSVFLANARALQLSLKLVF